MKTIIYSCHTNSNYIELQYLSIKKYFNTDFEYILFDDSRDHLDLTAYNKIQTNEILDICNRFKINYIRIPQELHKTRDTVMTEYYSKIDDHPVSRCALACQYGFNYIIKNYSNCYLLLIDCDMFFINDFNILNYMNNYDIAGIPQSRESIYYLWNGLFICNLNNCKNLNDFNWEAGKVYELNEFNNKTDIYYSCDVGGHNYYYLKKNNFICNNTVPSKLKLISNTHVLDLNSIWMTSKDENGLDYLSDNIKDCMNKLIKIPTPPSPIKDYLNKEILLDNSVIHIRGGGGWCYHKQEYHLECVKIIKESFMKE